MKIGDHIRISGGYDEDSPLRTGSGDLTGWVVSFVPGYEPDVSCAVVSLDAPLTCEGMTGTILVMELRDQGASWGHGQPGEQTVGLSLCSRVPTGAASPAGHGTVIESHAVFEIIP